MLNYLWQRIFGSSVHALNEPSRYFVNDPSTPQLTEDQTLPSMPQNLPFEVIGFNINNLAANVQATNCYINICRTLNYTQSIISKIDKPLSAWPSRRPLRVNLRAGRKLNAIYDRNALSFFYDTDPVLKKMVYASDSIDCVGHELGHAVLDCLRPDFWGMQALEIWAFHEAFGDINSIIAVTQSDTLLDYALQENDGDMMQSNVISRLCEEMGTAVFHQTNGKEAAIGALRDAAQCLSYVNPSSIKDGLLKAESHSFSQVFLGAWYEIMVRIYEKERETKNQLQAFKDARDTAWSYLIRAAKISPACVRFYDAVARNMIAADKMKNGVYADIIQSIFSKRRILTPKIKMLSATTWNDIRQTLNRDDEVIKRQDITVVRKKHHMSFCIGDYAVSGLSGNNPIFSARIDVPAESCYEFNQHGMLVEESTPDTQEILDSAILCAELIQSKNNLGPNKKWNIERGKLIRRFF